LEQTNGVDTEQMNYLEFLPDKWLERSAYRSRKYRNKSLQTLQSKKDVFEMCNGCPCFRIRFVEMYGHEVVLTSCIFINKCIKEYPHRVDKKEFR